VAWWPAPDPEAGQRPRARAGPGAVLQLVAIPLDLAGAAVRLAVPARGDVHADAQGEPVHHLERSLHILGRRPGVDRDGDAAVALNGVEVGLVSRWILR